MKNNLERLRFLSVPESLRGLIEGDSGFSIDPEIPIPVEIPESEESDKKAFDINELSAEMIIAGMLRVIQAGLMPENLNYYRNFVLAVRPGIFSEFTEAAILKARNGDFEPALEILDILLGLYPLSPSVMLNRALVLEQRSRLSGRQEKKEAAAEFQAAAEAYENVLSLQPPLPDAFFNAGFFYLDQRNYSRALECFLQYTGFTGEEEKMENARSIIREIETKNLNDENFMEACRLITENRETEGLECIRDFIESHPSVWNGWFVLGWALRRQKRWQDGAAAFKKSIDLGGGGSDTRNELAICLMESGDYKAARTELETALQHDPENIKIISNLGMLALKTGNKDQAAAFFRTVMELDPTDPIAQNFFNKDSNAKTTR